ncbi:MAG TPA: class I SAM-dependent methyltransferase [Actinophytocola sp.]|jgi:SAM-dependent methyltransferase|uniref:class I SAM-dependent methyltransferase n=1 Tax=Actinophytocola sp. TaxID=1872138 RepID=UPI002DFAAEB0|nr:class I SAM-dependent methyltransferase [Actinophytocola sp.]
MESVREFFDHQYRRHRRYWWREDNRYSLDPRDHTAFNGQALRLAAARGPGRALDVGAGEGADSIRLAKLGYEVDAVELSAVACEKIERFAHAEGVRLNVRNESAHTARLGQGRYDVVVLNGLLHYIDDKEDLLHRASRASIFGALHVISLFSTATPLPYEHAAVGVFPDSEQGAVERFYQGNRTLIRMYERAKPETSHPGFSEHVHSYIKLIANHSGDQTCHPQPI